VRNQWDNVTLEDLAAAPAGDIPYLYASLQTACGYLLRSIDLGYQNVGLGKPWMAYRKPDGSRDKLYEPGWPGELTPEELERLQDALTKDPDLARWWAWRPTMRRRAAAAIERVACYGDPESRQHNVKLVREFSRRATEGNESDSAKVKKSANPVPHVSIGRKRVESWESDLLRMAASGMGVKAIARVLRGQGLEISHTTVATRLRELKGQLSLIG
jgi:hypothetical protein